MGPKTKTAVGRVAAFPLGLVAVVGLVLAWVVGIMVLGLVLELLAAWFFGY